MKKFKKALSTMLVALLIFANLSVPSSAETYVEQPINEKFQGEDGSIQPLYDVIFSIELYATEEKVAAMLETDRDCSLQITITLYQEKGNGWSFLAKKSFSDYSTALLARLYWDFEPGVTYKAVANFNADGETDSMEDIFSF